MAPICRDTRYGAFLTISNGYSATIAGLESCMSILKRRKEFRRKVIMHTRRSFSRIKNKKKIPEWFFTRLSPSNRNSRKTRITLPQ
jgi:hypothetical protein